MMDFIKKLMEDNSITNTNGTGMKPKNGTTNSEESDSVKRRKKILKKLDETNGNAEDEPENDKSGEVGSSSSDNNTDSDEKDNKENGSGSDTSESDSDEKKENDTNKDKNSSADKSSDDETDSESENADTKTDSEGKDGKNSEDNKENPESSSQKESGESDNNEQESNDAESDNNTNSSPNSSDEEHKANTENTPDEWTDPLGEFETEDGGKEIEKTEIKKLDKSVLDHIESTVERTAHGIAERRKKAEINFDVKSRHYGNVVCKNEIVKIDANNRNAYQAEYGRILKKCGKDISLLTSSLRKIFQQDTGETYRALSGRYNVVRASKESTVKIFDRRRAPKQLEDIAVMLLIDESGSMYGQKATIARETAIILAESFATLQIPCYIMGFTTGSRCDALHHHYVSWKNQKEERIALAGISANNSNFDGYSIRNATQILKRRNAEHKLLFIISDGYPACSKYRSMSEGVADTAEAIQEAKKTAMVLGIGIGDCQPEILKHMYKGSFVHAQKVDGLANVLTQI
jgi:Mg-chelatase subunit ChlD